MAEFDKERAIARYTDLTRPARVGADQERIEEGMQETTLEVNTQESTSAVDTLLHLPEALLQIVQASDVVKTDWLDRPMIEPNMTRLLSM